jgi:Fic family protein
MNLVIPYLLPSSWMSYDFAQVASGVVEAKAAILSLRTMPHERVWVEALQQIELKREVAGTSRIEGADFTDQELEVALTAQPEAPLTRSQRQAQAAMQTYRWISQIPDDRPISVDLIREIHRRMVTGADDDRCVPGTFRRSDENVTFGTPRHRGVSGGDECANAVNKFVEAIGTEYQHHDKLIQAFAVHYHFAAMHPFLDGNGRTARALEALLLQRAGLRDICFVAMSNYYYDEKPAYLAALAEVRTREHDLTPFLRFALKGVELQSKRVLAEIRQQVSKAVYRNLMHDLFGKLRTKRKRVIAKRQIAILDLLLERGSATVNEIMTKLAGQYSQLMNPGHALIRDVRGLLELRAISLDQKPDRPILLRIRLEWPAEITEREFMRIFRAMPKAKTYPFRISGDDIAL